jgi:putative DNA primase/helicase
MVKVAAALPAGLVIADNDESGTGERVAKQIGWPYWMPPEIGDDFNDYHVKNSLFKASMAIAKFMGSR